MTPSPESRLLELIRKKPGPAHNNHWSHSWARLGPFLEKMGRFFNLDSVEFWRWANGMLGIVLLGTLGYGGFLLWGTEPSPPLERSGLRHSAAEVQPAHQRPTLGDLTRRSLFRDMAPPPPPPPVVAVPAGPPPAPKIPLSERAARFRLVGIISGANPQAIIEDTQTQRTIYASKGQLIEGILVESVTEGKVVLFSDGERFDITL